MVEPLGDIAFHRHIAEAGPSQRGGPAGYGRLTRRERRMAGYLRSAGPSSGPPPNRLGRSPHNRFGGRPRGTGPAPQAPRRAADPTIKVCGVCRYAYRAIDQDGQVIDVLVAGKRDADTARRTSSTSPGGP